MSYIGDEIKKLRNAQKLTRRSLSITSGITETTIYKLEQQGTEAELSTVQALAKALGTTVGKLLGEK
jgi:transcriptional regulator with XRE-family HTH domain